MQQVTVKVADLLEKIKANRETHRADFEAALEGFKIRAVEELERRLADVKAGNKVAVYVNLPLPEDHTDEYDTLISMFQMEVNDTVVIEQQEYSWYVLNNWDWMQRWTTSNASYTQAYASSARGR